MTESEYEMTRRHVIEGRAAIQRQRDLIYDLREVGRPIENAEAMLETLLKIQVEHEKSLASAAEKENRLSIRPVRLDR